MSVYVTDTHSLIWYMTGLFNKLSRRALRAFQAAERGEAFIYVPAVVLWEISRLEKAGEIRLNEPYRDWSAALFAHPCFECVALDEDVIAEARDYIFTRDVFDAVIVATAKLKDVPLITRDVAIIDSNIVEIFW
ncbi:MAG: type II toxin-antitoxin system VapC family toxin [Blastocatellia bacterium]|nr:type II toxin-antitoxin system VapC family toxin [Blastocatellia bacterium]